MPTYVNLWSLTPTQRGCMTQLTRRTLGLEPGALVPNMSNRKPYRTAAQKRMARDEARLVDGRYVSDAPASCHAPIKN